MKSTGYLLALFLWGSLTNVQGEPAYVVSHLSEDCSPANTNRSPSTEAEPTYAELANDPKANLPSSFTVCSMAMAPQCTTKGMIQFFALLDKDGENFISAFLFGSLTSFRLNVKGKPNIPPGVPNSCLLYTSDAADE